MGGIWAREGEANTKVFAAKFTIIFCEKLVTDIVRLQGFPWSD
jgi:hypothetical protein